MSIFARIQRTLDIPFGDRQPDGSPHTVTIQQLSGKQLARAREANQIAGMEMLKRMGGAEAQRELSELGDPVKQAELVAKMQADPLSQYDVTEVNALGIKAWTYEPAVTAENIRALVDELTEEAATFFARAILALTLPQMDQASQKNDSRPFTGSLTVSGPNRSSTTSDGSAKSSAVLSPA